jgi:hypothetical protein
LDHEGKIYSCPELEIAQLKLSFLKENFKYQDFFTEMKASWHEAMGDESKMLCQELRKDTETDESYILRINLMINKGIPFWGGNALQFGLHEHFISAVQRDGAVSSDELLKFLNPENQKHETRNEHLKRSLPILFVSSAVCELGRNRRPPLLTDSLDAYQINLRELKPEERILKIDMSKNIGQIKKEFEFFIKKERKNQKTTEKLNTILEKVDPALGRAITWTFQDERSSKAWKEQVEVWRLRSEGLKFCDIAIKQSSNEDTVKKRFYSAFEKITGDTYSPDIWKKLLIAKFESIIVGGKSDDNQLHKKYNRLTDGAQKERLFSELGDSETDLLNLFTDEDPKTTYDDLINSIETLCSDCKDDTCRGISTQDILDDKYGNVPKCPQLYKLLTKSMQNDI